ncbi:MAG: LamG domain-containing protein, partial [Lentisphaerae bacterium]|nr:LamG domain-containing protein [Lentisphaerota bacterium]
MSAKAPPRSPLFAQICAALIALTCCRLPGADLAGLQKGLLLHVPFEATLSPALANGSGEITCPGATYADGTVGKGVVVTDAAVSVLGEGNFRRPLGTVAFWVAPAWSPADTSYQGHRQLFDATNFAINYYTPKRVAFFMTGKTRKGVGYRWDYSVTSTGIRDWEPGEWHHVAATWNAATGRKTLCLDGAVAAEGTTQWLRDDLYMGTVPIRLGQKEAPGIYDEWMIWERCLSLDEIKLLAAHPERIAESLEARSASSSEPAPWPIDIGIVTTVPPAATVLAPGDTFTADIPVRNTTSTPFAGQIQFALLDFWEATRGRETRRIVVEPGTSDTLTVSFPAPVRGVFKVAAELTQRKNVWVRDVASFACWPKPTHAPSQDSFFGNHVNAWFDGAYLDQAQRLGQGWMRNHNMLQATWWVRVQPEPGEFQWTHDFQIDAVKTRAMPVLGQLFTTPYWAAVDGPVPRPNARAYPPPLPPDLDALRAYVGAVVTRYGNTTKHWEVWNEPDVSMFWRGSPEAFAAACQAACEAAKSADPDCVLMVGGFTSPAWGWHERAARAGALKSADAISFHYGCPLKPAEEVHAELQTVINHFQRLAREFGPGHDLPLWSTEGGTGDTTWLRGMDYVGLPPQRVRKPMNWHEGAIATVRGEAIQQVLGIERHFIYLQNAIKPGPHAYEGTSMLDVTNAPRPKLMARVAMAAQVDGATVAGCITVPEARLWAVVYRKPPPLGQCRQPKRPGGATASDPFAVHDVTVLRWCFFPRKAASRPAFGESFT